jgi:hypothetical protein
LEAEERPAYLQKDGVFEKEEGGCSRKRAISAHSSRILGFNFMCLYKVPIIMLLDPAKKGKKESV